MQDREFNKSVLQNVEGITIEWQGYVLLINIFYCFNKHVETTKGT